MTKPRRPLALPQLEVVVPESPPEPVQTGRGARAERPHPKIRPSSPHTSQAVH